MEIIGHKNQNEIADRREAFCGEEYWGERKTEKNNNGIEQPPEG